MSLKDNMTKGYNSNISKVKSNRKVIRNTDIYDSKYAALTVTERIKLMAKEASGDGKCWWMESYIKGYFRRPKSEY